jgi:hypothetical protein
VIVADGNRNKGPAFLLKIGDGGSPPVYATVAGLRIVSESFWPGHISVTARGIFTGSAAEARVKTNALSGAKDDYELSFEDGRRFRGQLLVTRLDYDGDYNGERTYEIGLEGKVEEVK